MKINILSPKFIIVILIALFFGISLIFRIVLPYDQVFSGDWVKFTSIDAYYQMRIIDNMAYNFPNFTNFDPYLIYPGGGGYGNIHFFSWFVAGIIWVISLGNPSPELIDVVGVYVPAILAALTIIPAYFIGKALFNRWAGVLAAGLVAILPGEYLGRSFLGFADTPAAETFFTATALAFFIYAIKTGAERQLNLNHLIQRDWKIIRRPLIYSLLAGIFLGIYLITWQGGMLFVVIVTIYLIIQFIINHLRGRSSDYIAFSSFILFLITLIIFLPISNFRDLNLALIAVTLMPIVLSGISHLISNRNIKPFYYPLSILGIGALFIIGLQIISPEILSSALLKFKMVFVPGGASAATTLEMQPFLSPQGSFSTQVAWGNYTTSFFLLPKVAIPGFAFISLIVLIWLFIKKRADEQNWLFFLIWTLIILVATLVQRRFAYYLAINIALLSAYLSYQAIWWAGLRKLATDSSKPEVTLPERAKTKKSKKREEKPRFTVYHANVGLAILTVFVFVFLFNIIKAKEVSSAPQFAPTDAWQESLLWMKDNTPDPLGDPDAYYQLHDYPLRGVFVYNEEAYGVTSWWDYGYWITRTGHRLPNANPSQAAAPITKVSNLLLTKDETQIHEFMQELDSSYVIIDHAMVTTKFWAIATWAERAQDEFTDIYLLPYEGQIIPIQVHYPEYYKTLLVRLYNFDGLAVNDEKPTVLTYEEVFDAEGNAYRQITQVEEFSNYEEALDNIEKSGAINKVIVGVTPFVSPVPLEKLDSINIIYSSEHEISDQNTPSVPEVKIFEYTR